MMSLFANFMVFLLFSRPAKPGYNRLIIRILAKLNRLTFQPKRLIQANTYKIEHGRLFSIEAVKGFITVTR